MSLIKRYNEDGKCDRETIKYDGIEWHRYPLASHRNSRRYFQSYGGLTEEGKRIKYVLHRYKYEQMVGKIGDGMEVDHIDDDGANNDLSNFQLLTKSEHAKKTNIRRWQCKKCGFINEKESK